MTVFGASVGVVIFHSLGSNLRHSHIKIRYPKIIERIFISPGQHQIHHSTEKQHFDKNFGVAFAIWDLMFGSLAFSENAQHKFGLKTEFGSKQSIMHLYVKPFKVAFETLQRSKKLKKPQAQQPYYEQKSMSKHPKFLLAGIIFLLASGKHKLLWHQNLISILIDSRF